MKYFVFFLTALCWFTGSFGQPYEKTKIEFQLSNLPDDIPFYLMRNNEYGSIDTIETVTSSKNRVIFKSIKGEGEMYFISLNRAKAKLNDTQAEWVRIFLDEAVIHVKGDFKEWPNVNIMGSPATTAYETYFPSNTLFLDSLRNIERRMILREISDSSLLKVKLAEYRQFGLEYFMANMNVLSIPLMIEKNYGLTGEDKQKLLSAMSERVANSYYGKKLKNEIRISNQLSVSPKLVIGGRIPDFQIEMTSGEKQSVIALAEQNRFTLIDFWAYWCGPCKEEIPSIKKVYEKYKSKGFNVLSISIDANRKAWVKALGELKTEWSNGIDHDQICKKIFSISAIPGYVLLNNKGEIIAMDVVGSKANGSSSKYFQSDKDIRLNGETMNEVIGTLFP